jgi:hypothetical protein
MIRSTIALIMTVGKQGGTREMHTTEATHRSSCKEAADQPGKETQ